MRAAANFAWANRQGITHFLRGAFRRIFGDAVRLELIYDVCHNIAKQERYEVDGVKRDVLVHRKGATRAFPPGHREIPRDYQPTGQPVFIPGSMGTASYVMVGASESESRSWASACHGAGRLLSRSAAKREVSGAALRRQLESEGIVVRSPSNAGLAEEAPIAYKDVETVVDVVERAGLARRVARLRPIGVVKG
jgi:tRNA-splicing ligase RtcB